MADKTETEYAFPRGGAESQRLNYQHGLMTEDVGFLLHPAIRANITPESRIADVATGTGIWLEDLAKSEPVFRTVQFHGFDISDAQFPEKSTLPPNIAFSTANIKEPFPAEFQGKFDAVNVRWVVLGMQPEDHAPAVANLMGLLKPGGAIQWFESDLASTGSVIHSAPTTRVKHFKAMLAQFVASLGDRLLYPAYNLERVFREAGLVDVDDYVTRSDRIPGKGAIWARHLANSWASTVRLWGTGGTLTEEQIQEQLRLMSEDIDSGAYMGFSHHYVIGFKPK